MQVIQDSDMCFRSRGRTGQSGIGTLLREDRILALNKYDIADVNHILSTMTAYEKTRSAAGQSGLTDPAAACRQESSAILAVYGGLHPQ